MIQHCNECLQRSPVVHVIGVPVHALGRRARRLLSVLTCRAKEHRNAERKGGGGGCKHPASYCVERVGQAARSWVFACLCLRQTWASRAQSVT